MCCLQQKGAIYENGIGKGESRFLKTDRCLIQVSERYMTAAGIRLEKYARLIPYGQVMFHEVRLWNEFRTIQAGGNKKKDQHRQDAG